MRRKQLSSKDLELRTGNTWQWTQHARGASPLPGMKPQQQQMHRRWMCWVFLLIVSTQQTNHRTENTGALEALASDHRGGTATMMSDPLRARLQSLKLADALPSTVSLSGSYFELWPGSHERAPKRQISSRAGHTIHPSRSAFWVRRPVSIDRGLDSDRGNRSKVILKHWLVPGQSRRSNRSTTLKRRPIASQHSPHSVYRATNGKTTWQHLSGRFGWAGSLNELSDSTLGPVLETGIHLRHSASLSGP